MKISKSAQLLTGLGLAASLFWGCQDLLSQKDDPSGTQETTLDATALRLSIKDDDACRDQWRAILAARTNGHPDSVAEAAFLSGCVTEVKPGKPPIPPHQEPDSLSRCHWIVGQIEGGRDSLTVTYKRYCPDECKKLETDSARHEHLCHVPGVKPPRPPRHDTGECLVLRLKLDSLKPGDSARIALERQYKELCPAPKPPIDTTKPPIDTTKPPRPPIDTFPKPPKDTTVHPPKDSLPKPPIDRCEELLKKLNSVSPDSAEYLHLKEIYVKECLVPKDTVVEPPKDTLPKPPLPAANCVELRARLLKLDAGSADYIRLQEILKDKCPEAGPEAP